MFVAGVPVSALVDYFLTGEAFGPSFVGSTITLVILVGVIITVPDPFTRSEARRRRRQFLQNRVALLVVLGIVLSVLLVWASAYLVGM